MYLSLDTAGCPWSPGTGDIDAGKSVVSRVHFLHRGMLIAGMLQSEKYPPTPPNSPALPAKGSWNSLQEGSHSAGSCSSLGSRENRMKALIHESNDLSKQRPQNSRSQLLQVLLAGGRAAGYISGTNPEHSQLSAPTVDVSPRSQAGTCCYHRAWNSA